MSSEHLLSLINDVLDMSKLESDSIELESVPFDIVKVCNECTTIVLPLAIEHGVEIHYGYVDTTSCYVLGSPLHMKQILMNLLSNAVKYNRPHGQIFLDMKELERTDMDVTYVFRIRDNGIGMTRKFVDKKLFEPFVQEKLDARTQYHGTGLGMSIVREIVKKMNGTIHVDSEVDIGTDIEVTLTFPLYQAELPKEKLTEKNNSISGMKILIAEDNELNLEIIEFMLEQEGADITVTTNGRQVVEAFLKTEESYFDAILMDIMMPEMDGIEATKKIRSMEREDAKKIPIIAMTANAFLEDVKMSKQAGMNAHLSKPVNKEQVVEMVASLVMQYRS